MALAEDKKSHGRVNTAVWLVRNNNASLAILDRPLKLYADPKHRHSYHKEQDALQLLLDRDSTVRSHVCLGSGDKRVLQGACPESCGRRQFFSFVESRHEEYRRGDFIAHFTGGQPPFPPLQLPYIERWMRRLRLEGEWADSLAALSNATGSG